MTLKPTYSPESDVEAAVEFGLRLIKEFPAMWQTLEPAELRLMNQTLFPQNLEYSQPGFKTAELAPIYSLKSDSDDEPNHYVTQVGQNWNQLIWELNGWLLFDRAVEGALDTARGD
ncbi:MAG: hypothetical protein KGJ34_01750 [Patescibacteria group bacterium]|nr:hypothetical protein [Patescibacteria group bacterium]